MLIALALLGGMPALAGPIELVRPRAGETLAGGSIAVVEWSPGTDFDSLSAEEWEAFLSVDGGGYYAVRLTPHLDVSHRRFTFRVPDVATLVAKLKTEAKVL